MIFSSRLLFGFAFFTTQLFAASFQNAYVSFEKPEGWRCDLVQKAWMCQSENPADKQEALVMAIASLATEWDKVENYEEYLKSPKPILSENGEPLMMSEVSYARKRNINGHVWVDSLHHNSELPGFWARYTVTVNETPKTKLAILVTYVVSDERRAQFAPQFERMVSSLKPNAEFDLNSATKQGDIPLTGSERLGSLQSALISERLKKKPSPSPVATTTQPGGTDSTTMVLVLVGAAALIGLVVMRRKRQGQKKTNPPR